MNNFDLKKYLAEGKLNENKFDVATTEKIAQAVADAFTAEDTELDLKYTVTPGTEESSFDLDVKAGPNTPGPEWRDKNGFSIDNYLGDFAGGSFYIKDGVVYNAASRNAPVANVTPEGEVKMISAADSRAAIDMEDDERYPGMYIDDEEWEREMGRMEENKYNPDLDQDDEEVPMPMDDEGRPLGESKEEKKSNKMKKSELKEMIRTAFLSEAEGDEEEVDVEDTEEVDVDTDVEATDGDDIDVTDNANVEMTGDKKEIQDNLQAALEAAKALGDQKLIDQIGNSITFFTRTHIVGKDEVAEEIGIDIDNPATDAEVGMKLDESINRMQKLAGLIK